MIAMLRLMQKIYNAGEEPPVNPEFHRPQQTSSFRQR